MLESIKLAEVAASLNEVPIGCVIVHSGCIIASAHNMTEKKSLATAHAEMLAIEAASLFLDSPFLTGCDLYVTMEPCPMCAYAIRLSRVSSVYFGCYDYRNGAFGGNADLSSLGFAHNVNVYGGIEEKACKNMLQAFFRGIRA